jgi:hypothetical protein
MIWAATNTNCRRLFLLAVVGVLVEEAVPGDPLALTKELGDRFGSHAGSKVFTPVNFGDD